MLSVQYVPCLWMYCKKNGIKFDPDLSIKKKNSIQSMKMGNYAKVFLQFPYNFWGDTEVLVFLGEPTNFASFALNLDHPKHL